MYKKILTICFSLYLLVGCTTTPVGKAWVKPNQPYLMQPTFSRQGDYLVLDKENAIILRNNIAEMKAYQEKLEVLVDELLKYYAK